MNEPEEYIDHSHLKLYCYILEISYSLILIDINLHELKMVHRSSV